MSARQEESGLHAALDRCRGEAGARSLDDPAWGEVRELVAIHAARLGAATGDPSWLVGELLRFDEEHGGTLFAARLAPLAATLVAHAAEEAREERMAAALARLSPIVSLDRGRLVAAPVGELRGEDARHFADRVLAEVARVRPRTVLLVLDGAVGTAETDRVWRELARELDAAGVLLERRGGAPR